MATSGMRCAQRMPCSKQIGELATGSAWAFVGLGVVAEKI